jgi:hypothetical protein
MAFTYSLLASTTVGSGGASTIAFNNIPQNYTDLCLRVSVRSSRTNIDDGLELSFNGIAGTAYSSRRLYAYTTTPASDSLTGNAFIYADTTSAASATASTFSNSEFYIPNYTSSNNKSVSLNNTAENNATNPLLVLVAGLFSNTSVISSIRLKLNVGDFVQYSTAYLYGIRAGEY